MLSPTYMPIIGNKFANTLYNSCPITAKKPLRIKIDALDQTRLFDPEFDTTISYLVDF
jgi:hypothetical protein